MIALNNWTQVKINDMHIYIADRPKLAGQGLCGVQEKDFNENKAIYFLYIKSEWGDFDNDNHDLGYVNFDINIAYLNQRGEVIKIDFMEARTGVSTVPTSAVQAIEAKPEFFIRNNFELNKKSPVYIKFLEHRARNSQDCYFNICT